MSSKVLTCLLIRTIYPFNKHKTTSNDPDRTHHICSSKGSSSSAREGRETTRPLKAPRSNFSQAGTPLSQFQLGGLKVLCTLLRSRTEIIMGRAMKMDIRLASIHANAMRDELASCARESAKPRRYTRLSRRISRSAPDFTGLPGRRAALPSGGGTGAPNTITTTNLLLHAQLFRVTRLLRAAVPCWPGFELRDPACIWSYTYRLLEKVLPLHVCTICRRDRLTCI